MTLKQFADRYRLAQHLHFADVIASNGADPERWSGSPEPQLVGPKGWIWFNSQGNAHTNPAKGLLCQLNDDSDPVYAVKADAEGDDELTHHEALEMIGLHTPG
jgi:hypothetical protein